MGTTTGISWTDATWNPVTGCTRVSPGCDHCYIERTPPFRIEGRKFEGRGIGSSTGVQLHQERLTQPLKWRKPRRVFVCSLADLFHADVPDDYIAQVFAVMAANYEWDRPTHVFQVLTKRPARMRALLSSSGFRSMVAEHAARMTDEAHADRVHDNVMYHHWPLPNVWLGVTAENQEWADKRVPLLLKTPAAVRFVSVEPMLGPVTFSDYVDRWSEDYPGTCDWGYCKEPAVAVRRDFSDENADYVAMLPVCEQHRGIDWVICGGGSGPGARPMQPQWVRDLRNRCSASGITFHFKQWGDWVPDAAGVMTQVGKRKAGRELDGRTWDEYPE